MSKRAQLQNQHGLPYTKCRNLEGDFGVSLSNIRPPRSGKVSQVQGQRYQPRNEWDGSQHSRNQAKRIATVLAVQKVGSSNPILILHPELGSDKRDPFPNPEGLLLNPVSLPERIGPRANRTFCWPTKLVVAQKQTNCLLLLARMVQTRKRVKSRNSGSKRLPLECASARAFSSTSDLKGDSGCQVSSRPAGSAAWGLARFSRSTRAMINDVFAY